MAGNINTEMNTVKVQEQSAASASSGTQQSASSKPNTVFETVPELNKKKKVLPPEIESLLRSKGYDPAVMTEEEINTTILLLAGEKTKSAAIVTSAAETVPQETDAAVIAQDVSKGVPSSETVPSQETPVTNPTTTEGSAVNVTTEEVTKEVKSQNTTTEEVKPQEQAKTAKYTEKDSVIDFNNEKTRTFGIDPAKTNVHGCAINNLSDEEKNQFFVRELAKYQVGEEKWDNMSAEEKAAAMKSTDDQLAEQVPSWSELSPNGKAKLAEIFTLGSAAFIAETQSCPDARKKPLNELLEVYSSQIVSVENEENKFKEFEISFRDEMNAFKQNNPKYADKSLEELNATGEINELMDDVVQAKLKANGGDLSKLNEYEQTIYSQFNICKKILPCGELKHLDGYGKEGTFDKIIENYDDVTIALHMKAKGSDEYKEAFRDAIVNMYNNSGADCVKSYMRQLLKNGTLKEKTMLLEIGQSLPKDIQNGLYDKTEHNVRNVAVAGTNGDDDKTQGAINGLMDAAGKNGDTVVQDNAMENINDLISDKKIAAETITDGLTYGGAEGYKRGALNGKITAEQVTDVDNVVLDKENNNKYSADVQNIVVETIGNSTVEGRKGLIDKAAENERTIKTAAAKYDTFGKEFEVYSAEKILECAEKNLPEKEAVEVLKTAADTNTRCAAENQAQIHKVFMESKYDEVLEHASSNIYKYDESAQADAIKATYATNNTKAIDACNGQIEQCSPKAIKAVGADVVEASVKQTVERVISQASYAYADAVIENNKITKNLVEPEELKGMSDTEKRQRLYEDFRKSTPSEQYRLLSKLSKDQLKTVIGMLCKANSSLIKGLVAQGLGSYVLQTIGKSPDVLYTTIDIMMKKGGKDAKCASEYVLSKQATTHFSDETIMKANEILGKEDFAQLPENETKKYTSNPYGFMKSTLRPGMSAVYPGKKELFFNA